MTGHVLKPGYLPQGANAIFLGALARAREHPPGSAARSNIIDLAHVQVRTDYPDYFQKG